MSTFDNVSDLTPSYAVQVFNTSYSWDEAYAHIDANADVYNSGWYYVPQTGTGVVGIERLSIRDFIRRKSICEIDVIDDELWMYSCDTLVKRDSTLYSPFEGTEIVQQPSNSKLIISIDVDGHSSADTGGTVVIIGTTSDGVVDSLDGSITSSATTIDVHDASDFDDSGNIRIGNEVIKYTGKTTTSFTGCTRGAYGTTAASHPDSGTIRSGVDAITIDGEGGYQTTYTYTSLSSVITNGLTCHISIMGNTEELNNKHEIRILCDTNNDGNYGLMFAGYMIPSQSIIDNNRNVITLKCVDYTDDFMSNEHIVGYLAPYRCTHYVPYRHTSIESSDDGSGGTCLKAIPTDWGTYAKYRWHKSVSKTGEYLCYVGDMNTTHPDGTLLSTTYRCGDYSPDYDQPLPYDGYTYDKDYTVDTDPKYAYYPEDYVRALYALKTLANSIDTGVRSRDFDLSLKGTALAAEVIDASETGIDFDNLVGTINTNDFIRIDNEWMLVISNTSGTLTVTRGSLGSLAVGHVDNSVIKCYSIANTTYGSNSYDFLIEANIGGTLYDTGTSIADILMSRRSDAEYVFWVDFYKQMHITEMYRADTAYTGSLTLTEANISKVNNVKISDVVNQISCWVNTYDDDSNSSVRYYRELSSDDVTAVSGSIGRFGLRSIEVSNDQLNGIGYDDTTRSILGFLTYAEKYLETHAYPRITQVVTIDSFVPDEHYWTHGYKPYLTYNDPVHNYICILGTRITCPDFSIDGNPSKTFVVEGIEYNITKAGNFDTKLTLSRISVESDYT